MFAYIFRQKAQHETAVFLKQLVFAAISSVGVGIRKMLGAIQFDSQSRIGTVLSAPV